MTRAAVQQALGTRRCETRDAGNRALDADPTLGTTRPRTDGSHQIMLKFQFKKLTFATSLLVALQFGVGFHLALLFDISGLAAQEANQPTVVANEPIFVNTNNYSLARLERIEAQHLPPALIEGPANYTNLAAFYEAANVQLAARLAECKARFENPVSRPMRRVTLISGVAGAGKTFLKKMVFRKEYPVDVVCKFDLRELYSDWQSAGRVEARPDLAGEGVVFNTLLAIKGPKLNQIRDHLSQQTGHFFVIDSLDEVHPDDSQWILEQIEQFVFESQRPFLHVVVLGRGSSFRDYWAQHHADRPREAMALFNLAAPRLTTTGDLQVSTWNYHCFRNQLSWKDADQRPFKLEDFTAWERAEFRREGKFANVSMASNSTVDASVEKTFSEWAQARPFMNDMLRNLAGNSMIREIAFERLRGNLNCSEPILKRAYLKACLDRNSGSHGRPSPEDTDLSRMYLRLLVATAQRMAEPKRLNEQGFFQPEDQETVEILHDGQSLEFPLQRILERSGLVYVDASRINEPAYRFEPLWVHRTLLEAANDGSEEDLKAAQRLFSQAR